MLKSSSFRHESHAKRKQEKNEYECADAACDVAVRYIECDVITQRNAAFDYSRLPPRGRLKYFSGRGDDGGYTGVCASGDGTAGLDGPQ